MVVARIQCFYWAVAFVEGRLYRLLANLVFLTEIIHIKHLTEFVTAIRICLALAKKHIFGLLLWGVVAFKPRRFSELNTPHVFADIAIDFADAGAALLIFGTTQAITVNVNGCGHQDQQRQQGSTRNEHDCSCC